MSVSRLNNHGKQDEEAVLSGIVRPRCVSLNAECYCGEHNSTATTAEPTTEILEEEGRRSSETSQNRERCCAVGQIVPGISVYVAEAFIQSTIRWTEALRLVCTETPVPKCMIREKKRIPMDRSYSSSAVKLLLCSPDADAEKMKYTVEMIEPLPWSAHQERSVDTETQRIYVPRNDGPELSSLRANSTLEGNAESSLLPSNGGLRTLVSWLSQPFFVPYHQ